MRKLELKDSLVKDFISANRRQIGSATAEFYRSFPPREDNPASILALTEYVTDSWTTVFDEGREEPLNLFPIVIGYAPGNEGSAGMWNVLDLPRPTMPARLGTGEAEVGSVRGQVSLIG